MNILEKKILARLEGRNFCTVFALDLARVWPQNVTAAVEARNEAIHAFAKARGWSATIMDPGIRVTFRRLIPGEKDSTRPKRTRLPSAQK
jgi:hypothetical protein